MQKNLNAPVERYKRNTKFAINCCKNVGFLGLDVHRCGPVKSTRENYLKENVPRKLSKTRLCLGLMAP